MGRSSGWRSDFPFRSERHNQWLSTGHGVLLYFPAGICKMRVDIKWWCLQSGFSVFYQVPREFVNKTERFWGHLTRRWVRGFGWCCRLFPEKESLPAMGLQVWWFLLQLVRGFGLGWSFRSSYSKKRMGFSLSFISSCAWSWQRRTLTPFKNTTFYCFSREVPGNWSFSVGTAQVLLFLYHLLQDSGDLLIPLCILQKLVIHRHSVVCCVFADVVIF